MTLEQNDPTRSGFTPPSTGGTRLSANEVETLCAKAARGAGLSWGLAEDAGYAARWLYGRGLDGPGALLSYLDWLADRDRPPANPQVLPGEFRAVAGQVLCPIVLGCAVSDSAAAGPAQDLQLGDTRNPVLLLAWIHHCARLSGISIELVWESGSVTVFPEGAITGNLAEFAAFRQAGLSLRSSRAPAPRPEATPVQALTGGETVRRLNVFAMRTTVPASSTSRADAGAGTSDND